MVERTAVRGGWRPLLYLTFCIYLFREILFLSGKSQGILKTHVCGNYEIAGEKFIRESGLVFKYIYVPLRYFL